MFNIIQDPHFWLLVGIYWIFNAAVAALNPPTDKSSPGYTFLYKFSHTLAGNITTAFGSKVPGNVNLSTTDNSQEKK